VGLLDDREEWRDAVRKVGAVLVDRLQQNGGYGRLSQVVVAAEVEDGNRPGGDDGWGSGICSNFRWRRR